MHGDLVPSVRQRYIGATSCVVMVVGPSAFELAYFLLQQSYVFLADMLESKVNEFMSQDEDESKVRVPHVSSAGFRPFEAQLAIRTSQDITFTEFLHMDRRNDKAGTSKSAGFRLSQACHVHMVYAPGGPPIGDTCSCTCTCTRVPFPHVVSVASSVAFLCRALYRPLSWRTSGCSRRSTLHELQCDY